jgi:tetratricopeptide (TPR) repeat protein
MKLAQKGGRVFEARYFLGQIAESENRLDEANEWYADVRGGLHYLDAQIRRALLVARKGDLTGAREQLRALPVGSQEAEVRVALAEGELLREAGRLQDAMAVYDGVLDKFPDDTDRL